MTRIASDGMSIALVHRDSKGHMAQVEEGRCSRHWTPRSVAPPAFTRKFSVVRSTAVGTGWAKHDRAQLDGGRPLHPTSDHVRAHLASPIGAINGHLTATRQQRQHRGTSRRMTPVMRVDLFGHELRNGQRLGPWERLPAWAR